MDVRTVVNRGVSTGLRLGRGTADRLVSAAGPSLGRLTDRVGARLWRPEVRTTTTTTFVPSRRPEEQGPPRPSPQVPVVQPVPPSPASVAAHIAPQRPAAKPVRTATPKSAPGAKLPPRRPSTS
jgi:hypothetical protein